jgi:hypothetical protein
MEQLNELKAIWLTANVETLPKADAAVKAIKAFRLNQVFKAASLIVAALILMCVMIWVLIDYKSTMAVTHIGETFMFIAIFIILGAGVGSLKRISASGSHTNQGFINFLKQERQKQFVFEGRTKVIGFAFASAGLLLYLFEFTHSDSTLMAGAYIVAAAWCAASWFVVRPRMIRRNVRRINESIEKLERLLTQLSDK